MISRAGYLALNDYGHAHEDVLGGVSLTDSDTVTIAIKSGASEADSTRDVQAILDEHQVAADGHEVSVISVKYSWTELYAIMYVLPSVVEVDESTTRVRCSVDVLNNRVKGKFNPLTPAIVARAAELWGPMIAVTQMPADAPRLRTIPIRRRVRLENSPREELRK